MFLVAVTGLVRNMNHIVLGTDDSSNLIGLYIGIGIILATAAFCFWRIGFPGEAPFAPAPECRY